MIWKQYPMSDELREACEQYRKWREHPATVTEPSPYVYELADAYLREHPADSE